LESGRTSQSTPLPSRRLRLADYLEAPLHHPWWVVVPFVIVVGAATAAAFLLPKRYAASSLILIKASHVPDKILANVTDDLDARRHQTIRQEILSRTRLEKVNEELHPYPALVTGTAAVAALQAAIDVTFRGGDAFSIEFTHRDPAMAMNVTNRLASLFIEEFRKSRKNQFESAADFLDSELGEARRQLDVKEEALRRYKEQNMGRLPEQMQATLSTLQGFRQELQGVEQNLELAEARLERLTSRQTSETVAASSASPGPSEREQLEGELQRLRLRYTDEHPDVKALVARLRGLDPPPTVSTTPAAENRPAVIGSGPVARARAEISALLVRRQNLHDQIARNESRIEQMPRKEQDLATLTRDFNQLRENYQTLLRRKMDAQMAERLQQRWTDDFDVLDLARLPDHHVFPNGPLFILAGAILGLGFGLGASLLVETFNPAVLNLEDLEGTVRVQVLAVLPLIDKGEMALAKRSLVARRSRTSSDLLVTDRHS
jgi:protein tyrosine kinase modulator